MIIGLVGFIGAGKGTVRDTLVREHGYHGFAFADALKDAVASIFLWPRGLIEGDSEASRAFREKIDPWWSEKFGYDVTPRLMLQKMGTEACRNNLSDNIWVSALEKRIQGYQDVVISDVRFPNEIDFIRSVGGKIIRVKRGDDPSLEAQQKMHVSETAWNYVVPDAIIDNNGTLNDLAGNIRTTLTMLDNPTTIFHHQV
jgi:hypothetical protein